jgi:hypothetical protein
MRYSLKLGSNTMRGLWLRVSLKWTDPSVEHDRNNLFTNGEHEMLRHGPRCFSKLALMAIGNMNLMFGLAWYTVGAYTSL